MRTFELICCGWRHFYAPECGLPKTFHTGATVVEMLFRLGLALILSLSLALLLAWGWDRSDPARTPHTGPTALAPVQAAGAELVPTN
jgi:hypothetical protein